MNALSFADLANKFRGLGPAGLLIFDLPICEELTPDKVAAEYATQWCRDHGWPPAAAWTYPIPPSVPHPAWRRWPWVRLWAVAGPAASDLLSLMEEVGLSAIVARSDRIGGVQNAQRAAVNLVVSLDDAPPPERGCKLPTEAVLLYRDRQGVFRRIVWDHYLCAIDYPRRFVPAHLPPDTQGLVIGGIPPIRLIAVPDAADLFSRLCRWMAETSGAGRATPAVPVAVTNAAEVAAALAQAVSPATRDAAPPADPPSMPAPEVTSPGDADATPASTAQAPSGRARAVGRKRSHGKSDAESKLIAALTEHHQYANGGCLNLEPIGNNELAQRAGVHASTASRFFDKQFKGYDKYVRACHDAGNLGAALRLLNGEVAPHCLYGRKPPGEGEPDQD